MRCSIILGFFYKYFALCFNYISVGLDLKTLVSLKPNCTKQCLMGRYTECPNAEHHDAISKRINHRWQHMFQLEGVTICGKFHKHFMRVSYR